MRFCGAVNLPMVYTDDYDFEIGKAVKLKEGENVAIIATGTNIVSEALKSADLIEEQDHVSVTVVNMHTIKPLDTAILDDLIKGHKLIVTIEEHSIIGGLGSAVSEYLAQKGSRIKQVFIGIEDKNYIMGSRPFMMEQAGLTANKIVEKIELNINQ